MADLVQRARNVPKPPLHVLLCTKLSVCFFSVVYITIGAAYLDECPKEHYIPIYLVVMGVFGLSLVILSSLTGAQDPTNPLHRLCTTWNSLVSWFIACWFVVGNVWIYRIYEPNYVKNETMIDTYCHKTLYLFAFWTTTLVYILMGALLVGGGCVLFCFFLCGLADPDNRAHAPDFLLH